MLSEDIYLNFMLKTSHPSDFREENAIVSFTRSLETLAFSLMNGFLELRI